MGDIESNSRSRRRLNTDDLRESLRTHARGDWVLISGVAASVAALGVLAWVYHRASGQPVTYLLGDTTKQAAFAIDPLPGAYTELGVLGWFAAAVATLFAAALVRRAGQVEKLPFLVFSGLLMLWFTLDDRFQFHEYYFPTYLGFSGSTYVVFYAVVIGLWTVWFRRILVGEGLLAITAVYLALAATTGFDYINDKVHRGALGGTFFGLDEELMNIGEEFTKLLGIGLWAAFLVRASYRAVARTQDSRRSERPVTADVV